MMEHWTANRVYFKFSLKPIIPIFQYSNLAVFQCSIGLER